MAGAIVFPLSSITTLVGTPNHKPAVPEDLKCAKATTAGRIPTAPRG